MFCCGAVYTYPACIHWYCSPDFHAVLISSAPSYRIMCFIFYTQLLMDSATCVFFYCSSLKHWICFCHRICHKVHLTELNQLGVGIRKASGNLQQEVVVKCFCSDPGRFQLVVCLCESSWLFITAHNEKKIRDKNFGKLVYSFIYVIFFYGNLCKAKDTQNSCHS